MQQAMIGLSNVKRFIWSRLASIDSRKSNYYRVDGLVTDVNMVLVSNGKRYVLKLDQGHQALVMLAQHHILRGRGHFLITHIKPFEVDIIGYLSKPKKPEEKYEYHFFDVQGKFRYSLEINLELTKQIFNGLPIILYIKSMI